MADDHFLHLFDPDPEEAVRKCELLRSKLIFYFQHHLMTDAEDLAQEVLLRIESKQLTHIESYEDLVRFSFGFARHVASESRRRASRFEALPENPDRDGRTAAKDRSAEESLIIAERENLARVCLQSLAPDDRDLLVSWYLDDNTVHKECAQRLNMTANALRIRIHRLLRRVQDCVQKTSGSNHSLKRSVSQRHRY
jgi:RNA polymerase sigma factor (sigma-70 family)